MRRQQHNVLTDHLMSIALIKLVEVLLYLLLVFHRQSTSETTSLNCIYAPSLMGIRTASPTIPKTLHIKSKPNVLQAICQSLQNLRITKRCLSSFVARCNVCLVLSMHYCLYSKTTTVFEHQTHQTTKPLINAVLRTMVQTVITS